LSIHRLLTHVVAREWAHSNQLRQPDTNKQTPMLLTKQDFSSVSVHSECAEFNLLSRFGC